MPRRRLAEDDAETEINLSPMIDCIFILLIFFIVTTVFVQEKGLRVNKPDAAAIPSAEEKSNLMIEITANNKVLLGSREIGVAEVVERVQSSLSDGDEAVVIRAHERADHGTFVLVWDAARRAGAEQLTFSTVN
jgi:biopolymer transport protein ExbD